LTQIDKLEEKEITLDVLKKHNLVTKNIKRVKVMLSGEINRAVTLTGIKATKGVSKIVPCCSCTNKASAIGEINGMVICVPSLKTINAPNKKRMRFDKS
jgi:hypothetical protein